MEQQPNQLNIEISEEIAEGTYANLAVITHSHAEFVIDFVNIMPGTPKSRVKSRIIFTPQHAKRFMKALIDNIEKFEAVQGPIKDLDEMQIPVNFGGPTTGLNMDKFCSLIVYRELPDTKKSLINLQAYQLLNFYLLFLTSASLS